MEGGKEFGGRKQRVEVGQRKGREEWGAGGRAGGGGWRGGVVG